MAFGDIVQSAAIIKHPVARANTMGPRDAMARTLAAFLEGLVFRVDGGDDPQDRTFQLNPVSNQWPKPDENINYPTASIVDVPDVKLLAHNLTPTPLEETIGQFDSFIGCTTGDATVLWKEGEADIGFQVDVWLDNKADRQAVEALLPSAFNPGEERAGVLVEGPESYYSQNMRFVLESVNYDDSGVTAYSNERRLRCVVRSDCDIVSLRMARLMNTPKHCVDVVDPSDPPVEEL